jgi:predicted nucleic acid-binding protein
MNYVVDTSIVNWLIDRKIAPNDMPGDGKFFATHVQVDEINRTCDEERRARLFLTLASSLSGLLPTETTVMDVSRFDHSKLGDGKIYGSIKSRLDSLGGARPSNIRDALIAEVCVCNSYTLLTADQHLAQATREHGGMVRLFAV